MRERTVVLTSATLTTSGTFDYVRSRLGLRRDAARADDFAAEERVLASPFDFGAQAALYLPDHIPDPREPHYLDAAQREITELIKITGGGAFVLCTSLRVMRALGERLARELDLPVLVQGSAPHVPLVERFRQQGDAALVARAEANAARNGIHNAEFMAQDLYGAGAALPKGHYDRILLDPPRSGVGPLLPVLGAQGAERLVYVSCNPRTLAQDAAQLVSRHGYALRAAGIMDMFPQTTHLESMALFELR